MAKNLESTDGVQCPSCGEFEDKENPLRPYCSAVCRTLSRHSLSWRTHPYRILVAKYPHLIVQAGPSFDLRDSALKGARERTLATERKRRQRTGESARNVTPTVQHNEANRGADAISGVGYTRLGLGGVRRDA